MGIGQTSGSGAAAALNEQAQSVYRAELSARRPIALRALAAALAVLVLWFALLESRPLWDPDEGRYAEIPREMVASGDWITPRLNDLLYFEKPALQYWATATAFVAFGEHNWTARLWSALTGLAAVLLVFFAGRRLHSMRAGAYAALMLASGVLYFAVTHLNTLDAGLTAFLSFTIVGFALGLRDEASPRSRMLWIHAAWLAAGLAVLSKGLVGIVLPAGALAGYALLHRDRSIFRKISPLTGGALLLLVCAPWFIAVSRANPDFAQFFFVHEHFTRYTTNEHHRGEPWWFFVPLLVFGALPWTWPMLSGLVRALRDRGDGRFRPFGLLAIWAVVVFVFFSLSGSKLAPYILPMFPALALLAGRELADAQPSQWTRRVAGSALAGAAILAFVPVIVALMPERIGANRLEGIQAWGFAVAGCWAAGALLLWWSSRRRAFDAGIAALAIAVIVGHQAALVAAQALAPAKSAVALARQLKPQLGEATRVYAVKTYPQSLPFYLERTVTLVHFRGELDFGLTHEPQKTLPTLEQFLERWRGETDAVAVMTKATYEELATMGAPMTVIAADVTRVAVRRPYAR